MTTRCRPFPGNVTGSNTPPDPPLTRPNKIQNAKEPIAKTQAQNVTLVWNPFRHFSGGASERSIHERYVRGWLIARGHEAIRKHKVPTYPLGWPLQGLHGCPGTRKLWPYSTAPEDQSQPFDPASNSEHRSGVLRDEKRRILFRLKNSPAPDLTAPSSLLWIRFLKAGLESALYQRRIIYIMLRND